MSAPHHKNSHGKRDILWVTLSETLSANLLQPTVKSVENISFRSTKLMSAEPCKDLNVDRLETPNTVSIFPTVLYMFRHEITSKILFFRQKKSITSQTDHPNLRQES